MTALQELWLHDNSLSVLPEGLADLTNLAVLTLSNNQLSALPTGLTSLHGLTEIWLKDNQLRSHPFRQGLMPNLKVLSLLLVIVNSSSDLQEQKSYLDSYWH
jgi:internalin A